MAASISRAIGDRLLSGSALVILGAALWATDDRIRDRAAMLVAGGTPMATAGMADAGGRAGGLAGTAVHVARVWSGEHVSLTVFAVAGAVLLAAVRKL